MAYGTINTDKLVGSSGGTLSPDSGVFRNRIINGAMVIDQRNAGTEVNPAVNNDYYVDRWQAVSSAASKFKIGQNAGAVTPPTGFINYLGLTSLSAYTVGASEVYSVRQKIEGLNIADLAWGTASAATVTLSFWVRSSLTGTFGGVLKNSASDRTYPYSYTISVANTWEQKTVTIAGDTSGTWLTTNGIGIQVFFSIGGGATVSGTAGAWSSTNYSSATGATSVVGTNGATFYITGVQLEKGSTATSFDYRPYGTELQLCQRYCFVTRGDNTHYAGFHGYGSSTSSGSFFVRYPTTMRTSPSFVLSGTMRAQGGTTDSADFTSGLVISGANSSYDGASLQLSSSSGLVIDRGFNLQFRATNSSLTFSSEL